MSIMTVKKVFLWQLILTVLLSSYSGQVKANQKRVSLFVATAAVLGVCKLYNMFESYGPQGREMKAHQYLETQLQKKAKGHNVNIPYASRIMTGDVLKSSTFYDQVIDSALLLAEQENHAQLEVKHMIQALDVIELGKKSNGRERDDAFKRAVAIHESGHIIATLLLLQDSYIVHRVIISDLKKGSGVTIKLPLDKSLNVQRKNLTDFMAKQRRSKIIELLAGGVAEQNFATVPQLSGKKLEDLWSSEYTKKDVSGAYYIARQIAEREISNQSFSMVFKMLTDSFTPEEKAWIDTQAMKEIEDCYEEAYTLIEQNKDKIQVLADKIVKDSIINEDDIYNLLKIDKPLYDFEQGPLPKNLIKNYELRGYKVEEVRDNS